MAEETVLTRNLRVGDIITETVVRTTFRKIVVKLTAVSAVMKSENGQDGRVAFQRKVKKQPVDTEVHRICHRDLSEAELKALTGYYRLGEYNKALFKAGLYEGLPPMDALFGYEPGEGVLSGLVEDGEVVRTIHSSEFPEGDKVEIVRWMRPDWSSDVRPAPEEAQYGARVIDGEHKIRVGYVRANLMSAEDAEKAADLYLGKRYFDGWDVEDALEQARYLVDVVIARPTHRDSAKKED